MRALSELVAVAAVAATHLLLHHYSYPAVQQDALLASREHLFALSELAAAAGAGQGSSEAGHEVATLGATLKEAVAHTAGLEKEIALGVRGGFMWEYKRSEQVAETRQLKEEEEMHMLNAVYSMQVGVRFQYAASVKKALGSLSN
eukprot:1156062-Pelagomonas_calceolata.AAC.3